MKRTIFSLICLILLTFAACKTEDNVGNDGPYGSADGLERFLTEIQPVKEPWTEKEKEKHVSFLQPEQSEHIFSKAQIEEFLLQKDVPETLTVEQATEDVNQAFQLLAYGYGGYGYFGGDEVFLPIRDKILTELNSMDRISTTVLWKLLWDALSPVIIDGHFSITTNDPDTYISDREYCQYTYFVRDLYFDDPTGIDEQYVKHTIGPDGAITYCLATVCRDTENLPKSMTIEGVEYSLEWNLAETEKAFSWRKSTIFSETKAGNGQLPVLQNYALAGDESRLKEFASTAVSYKKEPLLVLDLRGNSGGSDHYSTLWLKNFCGRAIEPKVLFSKKLSNLYLTISGERGNTAHSEWKTTLDSDGIIWETDNIVFVLMDRNVASSGEFFVNMLSLGKRVILVGSNTMGCLTFGNVPKLYLSHSGIGIRFGTSIAFYDSLENLDGIGFSPDLWVEPSDSLDAVVRLCKYYGLIKSNPWFVIR